MAPIAMLASIGAAAKSGLLIKGGKYLEILAQADKRGTEIVEEAKGKAREEGDRILAAANAEIEQEVNRAKEEIRGKVAEISVAAAAKIIGREVDAKAHDKLIKDLATQI